MTNTLDGFLYHPQIRLDDFLYQLLKYYTWPILRIVFYTVLRFLWMFSIPSVENIPNRVMINKSIELQTFIITSVDYKTVKILCSWSSLYFGLILEQSWNKSKVLVFLLYMNGLVMAIGSTNALCITFWIWIWNFKFFPYVRKETRVIS